MRTINKIVIHCSATRRGQDFRAADIDKWHRAQGWDGIGYHYVICLDGLQELGRPLSRIGSHVKFHNANSIGICLIGGMSEDGKTAEDTFTLAQYETLAKLVRSLRVRFPRAQILGHRDLSPDKNKDGKITSNEWMKQCPSFDVRQWCTDHGIAHTPEGSL